MKNKTPMMSHRNPIKSLDWLEEQEDDFLSGKTPSGQFQGLWEDEE